MNRPSVLILIATDAVGGPGKGLFQFLVRAERSGLAYSLCNFQLGKPRSTPFSEKAAQHNIDVSYIRQRRTFDWSIFSQALGIFDRGNFNIVQSHGYKSHLVAWVISRRRKVPWIAYTHGATNENAKIRMYNRLERMILRFPQVAVAVSPPLLASITKLRGPSRRSEMILNAVDPSELPRDEDGQSVRHRLNIPDSKTLVGSFGRLSPEKGHDVLISAFSNVVQILPDLRLLIVGSGPSKSDLVGQAESLGIKDKVLFEPHSENIGNYYDAIDVFVLPSRSEGLPNVVLESMSQGKPVVATDVGAIREIIDDNKSGWIVPSDDADAMSDSLVRILADKERMSTIGELSRKSLIPKFCPDVRAMKMMQVYASVLDDATSSDQEM